MELSNMTFHKKWGNYKRKKNTHNQFKPIVSIPFGLWIIKSECLINALLIQSRSTSNRKTIADIF